MMLVMMSAASASALMGLATTTHAWTPRLPAIQMRKEDRTFERWKQSITRQGNKGGYGQARQGMPQERYAPMGDQQGVRQQQGMPEQGYGPMTPRQRIEQQQFVRQQGMRQQGMRQQGMRQQSMRQQGMRRQGMRRQGMRQQSMRQQGMRRQAMWHQGMRQQGNGPLSRQQGLAPTWRRPSSGRWSQAEEKAARRAGMAGNRWTQEESFPMPPRQRGRVPFGDDWGVAGPSVSQPRTRSSAQAVSAVDSDEAMNSFAQRGYDQMPKQRRYGQMPMQQEFMPEFDEMYMQPDARDDMPMEQGFGQMPEFDEMLMPPDACDDMPMEQGFGPMQSSGETYERLSALEEALLGDGYSMQGEPPLQRLAFLEAQLLGGTCGGTVLDRLDQLEQAAQESGLL